MLNFLVMVSYMYAYSATHSPDYTSAEKSKAFNIICLIIQLFSNVVLAVVYTKLINKEKLPIFLYSMAAIVITWIFAATFHSISIGGF